MNTLKTLTKLSLVAAGATMFSLAMTGNAQAALITFDDLVVGSTNYNYDADGDGLFDVIFSTSDPFGFNSFGPGPNMSYIDEPGIEGTALLNPDLRVDFIYGATNFLRFGFARSTGTENTFVNFTVYDANNTLLASATETGQFTFPNSSNPSSFPEGLVDLSFAGTASYALFDFTGDGDRYIIDNFEGIFGSTEQNATTVPEPASMLGLLTVGGLGLGSLKRKQKA
jgi:hypothetical protein